jgi:hypothetical protein
MKTIEKAQACIKFLTQIKKECPQYFEGIETVQEFLIEFIIKDLGGKMEKQHQVIKHIIEEKAK